ncbi:uncharacterized protein [Tenebrio molitor]|uniref:uncharacterized protein n=1 Tax=Tenebrio molitor TaxID=7067 RepID=UPI0036246EB6
MATTEMSFTPEDVRLMWNELVALRQILRQEKKHKDDVYNHLVLNDAMITILQESQPVTDVSSPFSPAPAHSQQAEPSDSEIEMEETVEPAEEAPFTLVQGGLSKALKPFFTREVPALAPSPNHLPLIQKPDIIVNKPRGPCAWRNRPLTPAAVNKGNLRWHHPPATPRLSAPARHPRRSQTLGGPLSGFHRPLALRPVGTSPRRQGLPL